MIIKTCNESLEELLNSSSMVVMYFGTEHCGGCKMVKPIIEELSNKNKDIYVYYVDTSVTSNITYQLNVTSIPTTIIIKDNKIIDKAIGYRPLKYFEKILEIE